MIKYTYTSKNISYKDYAAGACGSRISYIMRDPWARSKSLTL
mgnify:CR=1 FL=1